MNRIQKKCFIASTGSHLLLVLILFVGPAFFSASTKVEDRPLIDFVPVKTVDELLSGGGNPNARPPAPQPPAPKLEDPKTAPPETAPKSEPPKQPELEEDATPVKPKKQIPKASLKPVTRQNTTVSKTSRAATSNSPSREDVRRSEALNRASQTIRENVSGSTTVELPGPGGGGVPYANFLDAVKKIYTDAWLVPDGIADDDAVVAASVTIARNGNVLDSRITRSSGNGDVDRSVQMTLDRVRFAVPLPESAQENERKVNIKFSVRAKRGLA